MEIESKRLGRYGKPPEALAEFLDPGTARIIDAVKEISRILIAD